MRFHTLTGLDSAGYGERIRNRIAYVNTESYLCPFAVPDVLYVNEQGERVHLPGIGLKTMTLVCGAGNGWGSPGCDGVLPQPRQVADARCSGQVFRGNQGADRFRAGGITIYSHSMPVQRDPVPGIFLARHSESDRAHISCCPKSLESFRPVAVADA